MGADNATIRQVLENEPELGSGDESKCLPGWIDSFCEWYEKGEGQTLSKQAVTALFHTLLAARERARRLVRERDEARAKWQELMAVFEER